MTTPKPSVPDSSAKKAILIQIAGVGLSIGSELIACAFVGIYLGRYLDAKFGWAPYGSLISIVLFLGGALLHIGIILITFQKKLNQTKDSDPKSK